MTARDRVRMEGGSGSVLSVAIGGAVLALAALVVPLLAVLAADHTVQNAADAAALAAADAASGAAAGVPCESAAEAARLNGANLSSCALDGLVASVTVGRTVGAFTLSSTARAGPPGS